MSQSRLRIHTITQSHNQAITQPMPDYQREVPEESVGSRIDQYLAAEMGISRGEAQRLLEAGRAQVNSRPAKPNYRVRPGDSITAARPEPMESHLIAEDIPLEV